MNGCMSSTLCILKVGMAVNTHSLVEKVLPYTLFKYVYQVRFICFYSFYLKRWFSDGVCTRKYYNFVLFKNL